jgi:hypothetical protein
MRMGLTRSLREFRGAGTPAIRALTARCLWACSAAATMLLAAPGRCADDFPPPITTQPDPPSSALRAPEGKPAAPSSAPSAAEGKPSEARPPSEARSAEEGATADAQPVEPKPERDVRIEQKHIGRRVSEVIVTPAGFTYHYSMTHLDDQDPGTTLLNPHPELSVPRFLRFDF